MAEEKDQVSQAPQEEAQVQPAEPQPGGPAWEAELDVYPLQDKSKDPKWAIRTVKAWLGLALITLTFILVLLVLGTIYE